MIELFLLLFGRIGDAVRAGEGAIHMIETTILAVDHHDGSDFREAFLGGWLLRIRKLRKGRRGADQREFCKSHPPPPRFKVRCLITRNAPTSRAPRATK